MAEAALKYDEFEDFDDIEPIQIPAGGIATFLTAREGMFADEDDIPTGGIASVKQVANQLAEYGRHEDEFMVHAAEGETVIPMEVFRKNPILKENIFRQMRDMGLEPERYVVGNEFNSINPVTGQPEFFLKKFFKKLGKFLKKAIKVILPIALNFFIPGLGVIASAAIGSGIGGLIQGESFGEALKSAAIGGLTAGAAKGISGGIGSVKAGGKFGAGFKAGVMAPPDVSAFAAGKAEGYKAALTPTAGDIATKGEMLYGKPDFDAINASTKIPGSAVTQADPYNVQAINEKGLVDALQPNQVDYSEATRKAFAGSQPSGVSPSVTDLTSKAAAEDYLTGTNLKTPDFADTATQTVDSGADLFSTSTKGAVSATPKLLTAETLSQADVDLPSLGESFRKLGPGGGDFMEGAREIFMPRSGLRAKATTLVTDAIEKGQLQGVEIGGEAFKSIVSDIVSNPDNAINFIRRFGPAAITAMGIGNLVSPGDNPESIDMSGGGINEAISLLEADPDKYDPFGGAKLSPRGAGQFNAYEIQPIYNQPLGTSYQSTARVAGGGGMNVNDFPSRVGAISGRGTETSDDIPAMLSDGEFVMTAEAVRGAGNGNRQNGMRNMYQMMNQFEARA